MSRLGLQTQRALRRLQACSQTPKHSGIHGPLGEDGPLELSLGTARGPGRGSVGAWAPASRRRSPRNGAEQPLVGDEHDAQKDLPSPLIFFCQAFLGSWPGGLSPRKIFLSVKWEYLNNS